MANSELYAKAYKIPENIVNYIRKHIIAHPSGEGIKRAKFIVNNAQITYQGLKRIKNFFDTFNPETGDKIQYELAGGDMMKRFIETTLDADRTAVERGREIKRDMTTDLTVEKPFQSVRDLSEGDKKKKKKKLKENAVAVIINKDNKILLLKRSDFPDQWQPGKWALVGGSIEDDETPLQACKREVEEETQIKIKKPIKSFTIQRNPNSIEHIFAVRFDGDPVDITLDEENTKYGWYGIEEIKFLDIVPHLIEYITLVFKKYD